MAAAVQGSAFLGVPFFFPSATVSSGSSLQTASVSWSYLEVGGAEGLNNPAFHFGKALVGSRKTHGLFFGGSFDRGSDRSRIGSSIFRSSN